MPDQEGIHLILLPSEADDGRYSDQCQGELRHFYGQLRAGGMKVLYRIYTNDGIHAAGALTGEFVTPVASVIGPVLATAVAGWFAGKTGRKLRLKHGDIAVEAGSEEELERLLDRGGARV
jgi:hypothetical protein